MGLSMGHNSPSGRRRLRLWQSIDQAADTIRPRPQMTIAIGGGLLKLQGACIPRPTQVYAPRGAIKGFSAAARKRLIELLASINRTALERLPLFVTLTYPATWPEDPHVWKEHLDAWLKRLRRQFERTTVIWKLEFQSRGAPHFHLLVFGPRWIDPKWLSRTWFQIVASGDERHLQAGTKVEFIRSWKGVMFYASKYLAKKTQENIPAFPGRFWGVSFRVYLPIELAVVPMEFTTFYRTRRLLIKGRLAQASKPASSTKVTCPPYRHRIRGQHQGLTLFGDYLNLLQYFRVMA